MSIAASEKSGAAFFVERRVIGAIEDQARHYLISCVPLPPNLLGNAGSSSASGPQIASFQV
jgi:hypothetical protein